MSIWRDLILFFKDKKHLLAFSDDVIFVGYTVPHPAESKMHFRIQANKNAKAIDILKRGLQDLHEVCDHTLLTFNNAMESRSLPMEQ